MQARKQTGIPAHGAVEEALHSFALPNPRHEAFAQSISLGGEPVEACRRIFRCKAGTAPAKSAALLQDLAITARIAILQQEASHIAQHRAHFTKADLIAFLVETIQTPVSAVDQHHRQTQEWTRDELTAGGRRANPATGQKTQLPPSESPAPRKAASRARGESTTRNAASERAGDSATTATTATTTTDSTEAATTAAILIRSKTKLPSKLDAAKLLATLCGWNAPTKVEGKVNLGISPTVEEALSRLLQ